jgi:hypothetical protein
MNTDIKQIDENKPRMFFKTVRSDYTSLFARGKLRRKYIIGKRYKFPADKPAHCFLSDDSSVDSVEIYEGRGECFAGNRVLICFGVVETREVPCFEIEEIWDFRNHIPMEEKVVSKNFIVIGEIGLPKYYKGVRPKETPSDKRHKVILNSKRRP